MKNAKKALASLAIAGMVFTMIPFNAFANTAIPTRLAGTTAAQTAVAIADQTGWADNAILASSASYGMCDALTAGPLATFLKAPILLQEPGAVLNPDTKAELVKLHVRTVYITSGTAVISQGVLNQLTGMGIKVVALGGVDKYETSVNIAQKMGGVTNVAVANGLQDALSIASIASASGSPILLTDKDVIPDSVRRFLETNTSIKSSDVIGGTGIISDAVKEAFPSATRHWGNTAYDTNSAVIHDFDSSLNYDNIYIANGVTGIDALAGAPLAAQTKSPIFLTDGVHIPTVYGDKVATVSALDGILTVTLSTFSGSPLYGITALGGPAVIPESILFNGFSLLKSNISDFTVTASGTVVTPSAISVSYATIALTVPTTDQPVVYSVSYRGGDPVVSTTQVTSITPNNVKVGQPFNVVTYENSSTGYMLSYSTNDEAIKSIKKTYSRISPSGVVGGGSSLIWTFQATQTGSYKLHFSRSRGGDINPLDPPIDPVDYIINVN